MAYKLEQEVAYDYYLDTVGEHCPVPITKTQAKMMEIPVGAVLCVASDDRAIVIDMPAWCHSNNQEYLGYRDTGEIIYCYIKKTSKLIMEP